jgi:hypothetical protein
MASSLLRIHDHTQTHHTHYDSSGRVIGPTQIPPPDNTQHAQEENQGPGWIRTQIPSMRAAADPLLRPRGHCDRLILFLKLLNNISYLHDYNFTNYN